MKRKPAKNNTTIDDLAIMVQKGFEETASKTDLEDLGKGLRQEMSEGFKKVDNRFDILEHKMFARHEREIEHLRDKVLKIEVTLAHLNK